jgi:hypothetical protein
MSIIKNARLKSFVVIAVFSLGLFWGCSYNSLEGYLGPDDHHATAEIGDYVVRTVIQPVPTVEEEDTNRYRVYLVAEYQQSLEGPTELDDIPQIAVRDLCVNIAGTDTVLCPEMTPVVVAPTSELLGLGNPELYTETFQSAPIELNSDDQRLTLEYVAELRERDTHTELQELEVKQELHRYSE